MINWSARTMAGFSNSPWKFIPVRRLAINIERSIREGTRWVKGEDNGPLLWQTVQTVVGRFLEGLWKQGAIIGEADIIDCVTWSNSPWFVGPYGFILQNPILYDKPIPYKGRLGFFEVNLP